MELPIFLKKAIEIVILNHPEWGTKKGAKGMCVKASDELLFTCDDLHGCPINGYVDGDNRPHHWAVIEGICVDMTARQFNEEEEFPKLWINN